ncbi:MAG: glucodextranase DOMON-like domain-containing protein [Pseudomonadota bacterium]
MSARSIGIVAASALLPCLLLAKGLEFKDPTGDDKGPGTYTYPTDAAYEKGCFDLTLVAIDAKGKDVEITVEFAKKVSDPWDSAKWQPAGNGFSVQMVQVYIDTDHKAGSGFTDSLPGMNAKFAADQAWDKVVIISPQPSSRVSQEVDQKAASFKKGVVIPRKVTVRGKSIIAVVDAKELGSPDAKWGVQALVGSNEGYPAATDLLSRKVNEFEGPHRFGGGCDFDGDPHFVDCLAGSAKGDKAEIEAQYSALKAHSCSDKPAAEKRAVVPMIYGK